MEHIERIRSGGIEGIHLAEQWADDALVAEYAKHCGFLGSEQHKDLDSLDEQVAAARSIVQNIELHWLFQLTIHTHEGLTMEELTEPALLRRRLWQEQGRDPN